MAEESTPTPAADQDAPTDATSPDNTGDETPAAPQAEAAAAEVAPQDSQAQDAPSLEDQIAEAREDAARQATATLQVEFDQKMAGELKRAKDNAVRSRDAEIRRQAGSSEQVQRVVAGVNQALRSDEPPTDQVIADALQVAFANNLQYTQAQLVQMIPQAVMANYTLPADKLQEAQEQFYANDATGYVRTLVGAAVEGEQATRLLEIEPDALPDTSKFWSALSLEAVPATSKLHKDLQDWKKRELEAATLERKAKAEAGPNTPEGAATQASQQFDTNTLMGTIRSKLAGQLSDADALKQWNKIQSGV